MPTEEWEVGDVAVYEGRKYLVTFVNPHEDTYYEDEEGDRAYHLWLIDMENRDKQGAYIGESAHDPEDPRWLARQQCAERK